MFFGVELDEEGAVAEVERAAGSAVGGGAGRAIVEAPAGGAAVEGGLGVDEKFGGAGLPTGVAAAEGFLVMHGNDAAEGLHLIQIPTGLFQRLQRRLAVARTMGQMKSTPTSKR